MLYNGVQQTTSIIKVLCSNAYCWGWFGCFASMPSTNHLRRSGATCSISVALFTNSKAVLSKELKTSHKEHLSSKIILNLWRQFRPPSWRARSRLVFSMLRVPRPSILFVSECFSGLKEKTQQLWKVKEVLDFRLVLLYEQIKLAPRSRVRPIQKSGSSRNKRKAVLDIFRKKF